MPSRPRVGKWSLHFYELSGIKSWFDGVLDDAAFVFIPFALGMPPIPFDKTTDDTEVSLTSALSRYKALAFEMLNFCSRRHTSRH
jgi:hypothetical protein